MKINVVVGGQLLIDWLNYLYPSLTLTLFILKKSKEAVIVMSVSPSLSLCQIKPPSFRPLIISPSLFQSDYL